MGSVKRHRVAIASNLALLVAAVGVVVVATDADGYRKHDAQLNDGGIWVTDGRDGFHGRVNKPIAELDGVVFAEQAAQLDVVQDGAAVFGIDLSSGVLTTIDPGAVTMPDGESAQLPSAPQVQLAGGTVAVLDPADGTLWAQRVDTRRGVSPVAALDTESDPVAATAADSGLAVTVDGEVLVASASDDRLRRLAPLEVGFEAPTETDLGADLGPGTTVTAVGDRAVVLDGATGALQVVGGPDADVPPGSVLQAPGPDASVVLVGTPETLLAVDLSSGEATEVVGDVTVGTPTAPVRLGACTYAAWSGGSGTVATVCDGADAQVSDLGSGTSDLVFRVNRGEIVLNDRASGAVWDLESERPTRLDNWDDFRPPTTPSEEEDDNDEQDDGDRRPPKAVDDDLGARPGRTTVLHPLDNDTAPAGRLLAITEVSTPGVRRRGDGEPGRPDRADRPAHGRRSDELRLHHRRRPQRRQRLGDGLGDAAGRGRGRPARAARGLRAAHLDRPGRRHPRHPGAARLARPRRRRPGLPRGGGRRGRRPQRRGRPADLRRPGAVQRTGAQRRRHRALRRHRRHRRRGQRGAHRPGPGPARPQGLPRRRRARRRLGRGRQDRDDPPAGQRPPGLRPGDADGRVAARRQDRPGRRRPGAHRPRRRHDQLRRRPAAHLLPRLRPALRQRPVRRRPDPGRHQGPRQAARGAGRHARQPHALRPGRHARRRRGQRHRPDRRDPRGPGRRAPTAPTPSTSPSSRDAGCGSPRARAS